jgi:hypothetical protein
MCSENIIILSYYRISKTSDNVSHQKWGNRTTQAGPPPVIFEVDLVTLGMTTPNLTRPLACKRENFAIFVGYCLKKIDAKFSGKILRGNQIYSHNVKLLIAKFSHATRD